MRYRVVGPLLREDVPGIPLFLIIIGGSNRLVGKRRQVRRTVRPRLYLVNAQCTTPVTGEPQYALPLPIHELLTWLWQRWELEVAHREMKSGIGVGDIQSWSPHGAILSVQFSVWVYALLMLAGYKLWGLSNAPAPPGRWRHNNKRWSITVVLAVLRTAILARPELKVCWTRSADNWLDFQTWFDAFHNSCAATGRL